MSKPWPLSILLAISLLPGCLKRPGNIYQAAASGDAAEVSRLLASGVDPNKPDEAGRVPLVWAEQTPNNGAVIDVLLRNGAKLTAPNGDSLLGGDSTNIAHLVAAGADVNLHLPHTPAPLLGIAGAGDVNGVRLLLANGADPNPPDADLMILGAVADDHTEVVKLLLKAGTRLGPDRGGHAMKAAVHMGNVEMVRTLLDGGADAKFRDEHGENLVMLAMMARDHRAPILEALVAAGADVNQPNNLGEMPMQRYQQTGPDAETAEILESHGARTTRPRDVPMEHSENGHIP